VAGVCALILSAHPELTPMEVIYALRKTSSLSGNPNNVYGYGIVNAYDAILSFGYAWGKYLKLDVKNGDLIIKTRFALKNPVDAKSVKCVYAIQGSKTGEAAMELININDPGDNSYEATAVIKGVKENISSLNMRFYFSVKDNTGKEYKLE
jgi:hypothetical protein